MIIGKSIYLQYIITFINLKVFLFVRICSSLEGFPLVVLYRQMQVKNYYQISQVSYVTLGEEKTDDNYDEHKPRKMWYINQTNEKRNNKKKQHLSNNKKRKQNLTRNKSPTAVIDFMKPAVCLNLM